MVAEDGPDVAHEEEVRERAGVDGERRAAREGEVVELGGREPLQLALKDLQVLLPIRSAQGLDKGVPRVFGLERLLQQRGDLEDAAPVPDNLLEDRA